jgi:glycosyltransferase involved in cell wall biosynthesis
VRVGVEFSFLDPTYTFGIVYYKGLLRALRQAHGEAVTLVLLSRVDPHYVEDEAGSLVDERLERPPVHRWTRDWVRDRVGERLLRRDVLWEQRLADARLDVLMFGRSPAALNIPTLGWLPDFQHHHLPEMFEPEERRRRDRDYRRTVAESTLTLLMSAAVQADFARFAPELADRTRVLHPMTVLSAPVLAADPREVARRYHLPERFVLVPNQFWTHKNHGAIWEALSLLAERGVRPIVVCVGHVADPRHPRYFGEVLCDVARRGLREQVVFLGITPHGEVLQLMRESVAVLNPSRFEGFGMSVNEARTLGKPCLLSDLPSHREQDPPLGRFFPPDDPAELARRLAEVWETAAPGPNRAAEQAVVATNAERLRDYGARFHAILGEAARLGRSRPTS